MTRRQTTVFAACAALACSLAAAAAPAQAPEKPEAARPEAAEPAVDPKEIWPAGLPGLAGRYLFAQVASPGGLWETTTDAAGKTVRQQVSLNELPAAVRQKLLKAEIAITVPEGPRRVQAARRLSPSKRGELRFYEEEALGSLTVRNLPGIQGREQEVDFSGPALLILGHQSHSNPSVSGVLQQRTQQEQTWGAATLDYADLMASTVPKDPNAEGETVLSNARVLRSGTEIFAYVEWREKARGVQRTILGSVRLQRVQPPVPAPVVPGKEQAGASGAGRSARG